MYILSDWPSLNRNRIFQYRPQYDIIHHWISDWVPICDDRQPVMCVYSFCQYVFTVYSVPAWPLYLYMYTVWSSSHRTWASGSGPDLRSRHRIWNGVLSERDEGGGGWKGMNRKGGGEGNERWKGAIYITKTNLLGVVVIISYAIG
jgi:hypothetical protein